MPVRRFVCRLISATLLIGMILFSAVISHSIPLEAQGRGPAPSSCLAKLQNPSLKNIDCTLNFFLDKRTQQSMQGITAGLIQNAACKAKISVTRKMIFTALLNEKVLQVPKQPVSCNIYTIGEPLLAKFNMAPRIRFAGGKAVQARPGMSDVLGLPELLAKLLTDWVNSSQAIESAMLHEVNKSLKLLHPPSLGNMEALKKKGRQKQAQKGQ